MLYSYKYFGWFLFSELFINIKIIVTWYTIIILLIYFEKSI